MMLYIMSGGELSRNRNLVFLMSCVHSPMVVSTIEKAGKALRGPSHVSKALSI